jgi:ActR/RegA family two-component response regulator
MPSEREVTEIEGYILDGMARALWVHAFMIWSTEVEAPPVMGGSWEEMAPDNKSTRAASREAAEALSTLIREANRLGDPPLADLFGKVSTTWNADRAKAFGEEVAHLCMGTRDPDDSMFFLPRSRPSASNRWDPVFPPFTVELDDEGRDLSWDGGLDESTRNPCGCHANPGDVQHILVIEDDPQLQRAYPRMMRKMYPGAEVTVVDNYHDAIGHLDTKPVGLIISDVDLVGDRTGIDVFEWVKENRPDLVDRYVFVTGGNPQVEQLHYRYAEKPVTVADIQAAIDRPAPNQIPNPAGKVTTAQVRKMVKAPISDIAAARIVDCINDALDAEIGQAPARETRGEMSLETFAQQVLKVLPDIEQDPDADGRARGRFGHEKVFIAAIWRATKNRQFRGMFYEQFKQRLVDANRQRLLELARADLVGAMNHQEVVASEIRDLGSEFHFVLDPHARARQGW